MTDYEEVIADDGTVRAISRFSDKTDLLGANYTTFWRNLLYPSSLFYQFGGSRCLKNAGNSATDQIPSNLKKTAILMLHVN